MFSLNCSPFPTKYGAETRFQIHAMVHVQQGREIASAYALLFVYIFVKLYPIQLVNVV